MKADIRGCLKAYHFSLFKEFMGVNRLQLTNAKNAQMIFKAILEPLIVASVPKVNKKQRFDAQGASESLVDEEIADTVMAPRNRFYK